MHNYVVHLIQYCKPIEVKANSEDEVRKVVDKKIGKIGNKYSTIEHVEVCIRNKNQSWIKSFIEDNF